MKYSALAAVAVEDNDVISDSIVFTFKDRKLYVLVVNLSTKDNQKFSKISSKGFKKSVYWNQFKAKGENKNTAN